MGGGSGPRYMRLETIAPVIYNSLACPRGQADTLQRVGMVSQTPRDTTAKPWRTKERDCQNSWGSRAVRARECDEVTEEQECHDRG